MSDITESLKTSSRVGVVWGVLVIIMGMFCIIAPGMTGLGLTMILGLTLIATAIVQVIYVFKSKSFGEGFLKFLFAVIAAITGVIMLMNPAMSLASITLFLAIWFIVDGIWSIFTGIKWKPFDGWGSMVFGGILSIICGVFVYYEFPSSAIWVVGTLVGVRIIVSGWTMIAMGAASEAIIDDVEKADDTSE